jgi:hypothetical protein
MYTYEDYKNAPQALTIKEANQILLEIQKEITDEKAEKLYHDVELAGIEYIHVRTNWYRMTKEEKKAVNDQRTLKHNAVINSLDALADYLYDLDLDFDVDMDGDMLIDDILMMASDGEAFETEIGDKKARYLVKAAG